MAAGPDAEDADAIERAITLGLERAGMRESQRAMVRSYLDEPPDVTSCCGSSCDPCVVTLALAVRVARRALGREP